MRDYYRIIVDRSLVLPLGASLALVWANVAHGSYESFAHALEFVVNDIGMVFFFAIATKEVVEAVAPGGALDSWRRAALPCIGAVGGMVVPALVYVVYAHLTGDLELVRGWAIPCATDIAFSYMVARAIFPEGAAIPFLLLLAIADDALGLVILAVFYPARELRLGMVALLMAVALAACWVLRRRRTTSFWPYIILGGVPSWAALFLGGLHPALALVPIVPFLPHAARDPGLFVDAPPDAHDALSEFEHWWKLPVQGILLLFGLVNAGVAITQVGNGTGAVLIGLLAGKPLGIAAAVMAAVALGFHLPDKLTWRDVLVTGSIAGIGFTVALFFATAAFPGGPHLDEAKLGALLSIGSAVVAIAMAAGLRVGRFATAATASPAGRRG